MTIAVVILAPESSGTRLCRRLLMEAGCRGEGGAEDEWNGVLPDDDGTPLVWRRSVPCLTQWVNIPDMASRLRARGYDVWVVTIRRSFAETTRSQVRNGYVETLADAEARTRRAIWWIADGILRADLIDRHLPLTYSGLVLHPETTLRWLFSNLSLPTDRIPDLARMVYDGNAPYQKGIVNAAS